MVCTLAERRQNFGLFAMSCAALSNDGLGESPLPAKLDSGRAEWGEGDMRYKSFFNDQHFWFYKKKRFAQQICVIYKNAFWPWPLLPSGMRKKWGANRGLGTNETSKFSLRLCPMPCLTEEDRDVTFWSDLLPPLGRGPLMRQFRRRGHRLWKGRRSTRRWMKQWKERKLKVTPSTLWFLTPKYVNLIPTKMQKNVFSPAVLSTLLHASNYFLAVPKMIDGKLANFL